MEQPVLKVDRLRKDFAGSEALRGVSMTVQQGEIVGLLGANGAGKTTLISIILGLVTPTSGSVQIFGLNHRHDRIAILERLNFCSSYTGLPSNLTVRECLTVFGRLYGVRNLRGKIAELMEMLEIPHLQPRIFGELSSGESTRVHLVKALLNDPDLLLLDEPTASLDPDIADKVRKLLRRIQTDRKITMVYTSHNMRDVEEVCDRVIFLHQGRILREGRPSEIASSFGEKSLEDVFIRVARGGELNEPSEREAR